MSDKVVIKNLSSYKVGINLANVRFRRDLTPGQSCPLAPDVFEEFNYDPGCRAMVRAGVLKVITESEEIREQLVETAEIVEIDIKKLLVEETVSELNRVLNEASDNLKSRIVEEAIKLSIADAARVALIKKHCGVDIVNSLSLQRSIENN